MKLTLYNIEQTQLELIEQLIDNGGELTSELEEALKLNEENLQTKGTNYGIVIKQIESECEIIDAEIKRLTQLKKSRENSVNRLKENIKTAMQIFGIVELKTPLMKINFRKSESVEVDNLAQLDSKFLVEKVTITPDKTKIKEAIKAGEEVNGARIVENQNLQIK